ncbi:hypothetical protein [Massilia sp. BJB1822]|uniref:hypothetical protein n=1 Tax=Massilia sp. BJB1822 TaxID=2744470 RepID=UPI001592E7EE|nr:hypothetical protein [Massilia sp. BJB1822]NVD97718.1 hypothetical protein [Massilia sp. BJB1822]
MPRATMSASSYGTNLPMDLLEKLRIDAQKLSVESHPYDVFNFMITAAVLNEWSTKVFKGIGIADETLRAVEKKNFELLPEFMVSWVIDISCLPNKHCGTRRHIMNALRICWDTANARKHYHWFFTNEVNFIGHEPVIDDWYKWAFTSVESDFYIDYARENYGLT